MRIKKTSKYIEGGASLSNTYGTSQTDGYSQEYLNGYVLYENSTGTTDTITLSDSAANYRMLKFYFNVGGEYYSSVEIYNPNGNKVCVSASFVNNSTQRFIMSSALKLINGTSITNDYSGGVSCYSGQAFTITESKPTVTKVVGYK